MLRKWLSFLLVIFLTITSALPMAQSQENSNTQTMTLPGLDGEVTIQFDAYDVPAIYASTPHDLVMAQGYIHAANRWWQMDWFRHLGAGRLSELVGDSYLEQDIRIRTLGLWRAAERDWEVFSPETKAILEAYTAGVNAYIADKTPEELADEYGVLAELDYPVEVVELWEPLDTLVWQQAMALSMSGTGLSTELIRAEITQEAGVLAARLVIPPYPYDTAPLIMEPGWQPTNLGASPLDISRPIALPALHVTTLPLNIGSNNWVVSGELTESGSPLLANDPHITTQMPGIWYRIGLHCVELSAECPFNVAGFGFAGSPGVVLGHNDRIGWGMTNIGTDIFDVYLLEVNPDNPYQYRFNDDWVEMDILTETVERAGAEPVTIEIRLSRFGPVFDGMEGIDLGQPFAVHWASSAAPNRTFEAVVGMNRATNWEEFQQAVTMFDAPGQNIVYGDVAGNIGYITSGRIPIRVEGHDGTMPVPGIDDSYDWQGFVDPMENPRLFNPAVGYISSANNAVLAPDDFPETISTIYSYGFRAARIETLLQSYDQHNLETMQAIQFDNYVNAADWLIPALQATEFTDDGLNETVDWLAAWDYQADAASPQAALFNVFWQRLILLTLEELPTYEVSHNSYLLSQMIGKSHPLWENEMLGTDDQTVIFATALEQALDFLTATFGGNSEAWNWGELHQTAFIHPLSALSPVADRFNRKVGASGWGDAVNATDWNPASGNFFAESIPSMRNIMDFSNWDNSLMVLPLGQSGDPDSPHFDDQMALWASGQYTPHHFSREAVEANTVRIWVLQPAE